MTDPVDLVATANATLNEKIERALQARKVGSLPPIEAGPVAAVQMLLFVRDRMDIVEDLLSEVVRFRTDLRALARKAAEVVDDKWAEKITDRGGGSRMKSFDGFGDSAPRERYAAADLHVLDERIRARQRERILDSANDAVDVIQRALRGLDSVRMDLHLMTRAMPIEAR